MKNTIKLFGMLLVVFGVFVLVGSVSASHADLLQPAETVTYDEEVAVNGTLRAYSARIGNQEYGGVTFFNGTIVNETTGDNDADIPVTFGDNVRIDGTIYRGETAGPGDNYPLKVDDDVRVYGDLTVEGGIAYNNSSSGLAANNVQDAIDEIGTKLTDAISGPAAASSPGVGELTTSTWRGVVELVKGGSTSPPVEAEYETRGGLSVTFTPTSATRGTYSATKDIIIDFCDAVSPCTPLPAGTVFTGSYKIVGNNMLIVNHAPLPPEEHPGSYGTYLRDFKVVGDVMTYENGNGGVVNLERE